MEIVHQPRTPSTIEPLRRAIMDLDQQRQEMVAAGDTESILRALAALETIISDLQTLRRNLKHDGGAMVAGRYTDIEHVARFERVRESAAAKWDDAATIRAIIQPILDPDLTGEIPEHYTAIIGALRDCARLEWRSTAIKERGINPDDEARPLREVTPAKERPYTIRLHRSKNGTR